MKKIALAALIAASIASPAFAASGNTSTAAGSAAATVVSPITLTHTTGATLNFGKFTAGTGGTVAVTAAAVGSVSGDVGFVPGSVVAADAFTVYGDVSRNFSISTGAGSVANATGATMAFTTTPSAANGTTDSSGNASFTVGGTLTVGAAQATGVYNGSYNATVTYN